MAMPNTDSRREALKILYDGYEAIFEPPGSALIEDMLAVYPGAKVRPHAFKPSSIYIWCFAHGTCPVKSLRAHRFSSRLSSQYDPMPTHGWRLGKG